MPLDPQVAAHYASQASAASSDGAFRIEDLRLNADLVYNDSRKFPSVFRVEDFSVPCSWGDVPVRVYTPGAEGPYPVLIYYHGGGFIMHNIQSHDSLCRRLCNVSGCAVVNVGYRLAPEAPYPAAVEDSYAALQWVYEHSEQLGIDPARIAVAGDSAGAALSAVMSLLSRDRGGPAISGQVLCYGIAGCLSNEESASMQELGHGGYVLTTEFIDLCMRSYHGENADEDDPYLNPGRAKDLSKLPKTYLITAEYDPLRDDGEAFGQRLKAAGNEVTFLRAPGMMHGFLLLWEKFDRSREIIDSIGAWLKELFRI